MRRALGAFGRYGRYRSDASVCRHQRIGMKNSELSGAPILQRDERRGSKVSEHVGRLHARAADRLATADVAIDPAGTVRPVDEKFSADSV